MQSNNNTLGAENKRNTQTHQPPLSRKRQKITPGADKSYGSAVQLKQRISEAYLRQPGATREPEQPTRSSAPKTAEARTGLPQNRFHFLKSLYNDHCTASIHLLCSNFHQNTATLTLLSMSPYYPHMVFNKISLFLLYITFFKLHNDLIYISYQVCIFFIFYF